MMKRSRIASRSSIFSILAAILLASIIARVHADNDDDANNIQYWTDYAIYPKRCVTYNNADQIMYAMYEQYSNHCSDTPLGTYIATVPTFANAYLQQLADNAADSGEYADGDFQYPDMANYVDCTSYTDVNGDQYYVQLGCNDDDSSQLAVNIYTDNTCTTPSVVDGYDDSNIQLDTTITMEKCTPCVIWSDKNDDEIDDQYYFNKQTNAPLCSAMWEYGEECGTKCQMMGKSVASMSEGWNRADKILLSILSLFGFGMLLAIIKKRQKMSQKDALVEQAAISAVGLQPSHILGIFALLILIITMFGLLGLKKITWALMLLLNIVLFAYLMKLTVDSSVKETIIGPDGKIVEEDDSDEEDDDDEVPASEVGPGKYENPAIPPIA